MNDPEVIQSILKGKRDNFRILVERYQEKVFHIAMGFVHEKEEAEDLTQEIFLNAWKSLYRFKGDSLFSTWLHRIAVNACLNHTRKNKGNILTRISSFLGYESSFDANISSYEENPEDIMIKKEQNALLKEALDRLPENQHTAIVLSKYEALSQKQIAEILNITEGAVEALIQRAKKNLRENLLSAAKRSKRSVGKPEKVFLNEKRKKNDELHRIQQHD